jgi:general secretion pathway protein K
MPRAAMNRRQHGIALITALLVTTLAVTVVAGLFWQQQVQVRGMENQRLQLQTQWIMRGALDQRRALLAQDLDISPNYTHLNGVWAQALPDTALDSYIDRQRSADDDFRATLSGRMVDAQSRFNLTNLARHGIIDMRQVRVLERLLTGLRIEPALAQAVAAQVAGGQPPLAAMTGAPSAPAGTLELLRIEDLLAVSGFPPESVRKLGDFVIVLPQQTPINVNTAPAELLAALVENLSTEEAAAIVKERQRGYYRSQNEFDALPQVGGARRTRLADAGVRSDYFLAIGTVRLGRAAQDTQALLWRRSDGGIAVWSQQDE